MQNIPCMDSCVSCGGYCMVQMHAWGMSLWASVWTDSSVQVPSYDMMPLGKVPR